MEMPGFSCKFDKSCRTLIDRAVVDDHYVLTAQ